MKGHWIVSVLVSILILGGIGFPQHVFAEVIYESATIGPGAGGGAGIFNTQFIGSRFSITETVEVTSIGGHMGGGGTLFGAIVELPGGAGLPAGSPFTGGEVLASTVFTFVFPNQDVSVPLSVILPPGDYALVFGTGLFGASGSGGNGGAGVNTPEGVGSFFLWNNVNWQNGGIDGRFTVNGNVLEDVPVGGTILPIDTTALLVAGAQTISPWLILGVLAAVGIGIAVFTIKRSL